jgi:hypothetical protein
MELHRDPETNERWFLDDAGDVQYFDGNALADVFGWTIATVDREDGTSAELEGFGVNWTIEARTLCYQSGFYREVQRSRDRLLIRVRTSMRELQLGFDYPDVETTKRVFASFDRHPLAPFTRVDPYVGLTADEIRAADDAEAALIRRGIMKRTLVYIPGRVAVDDMPLPAWLTYRSRDDKQSALWHIEALPAIAERVALEGLEITLAPPATDDEIAAYEKTIGAAIPASLRELWKQHASAGWRLGASAHRLLSPVEAGAQRAALQASLLATAKAGAAKRWPLDRLEVIAVDQDNAPTIAFHEQRFTTPPVRKDSYWTDALGWSIATTINLELTKALKPHLPKSKKKKSSA